MKGLIFVISAVFLFSACSQNTNRQDFEISTNTAQVSITPEQASAGMKVTEPVELLPEIEKIYSGIQIEAVNKKNNNKINVFVPFNETVKIGDTGLSIYTKSYFTDFTINAGGVKNVSMVEKNPGAKVTITNNGKEVFDGWLFQNFPEMHPFEHPEWKIIMLNGVKK